MPNGSNFKHVLYLAIITCLYQAIANTELAIFSQFTNQNSNSWIGSVCIALLFLGSGTAALYSNYIKSGKYKKILFFGSFGYTIFIALTIVFLFFGSSTITLTCMIVFSLIAGIIASLFYNGQINYVNYYSQLDGQTTKYFGLLMGIVQSANIIGNCLSAILIQPLGQQNYVITMQIIIFVISFLFLAVNNVLKQKQKNPNIQQSINNNYSDKNELIIIQQKTTQQKFPIEIFFCFALSGIIISYVYGQLSVLIYNNFPNIQSQTLNKATFIIFIVEGIGQFIGGMIIVCCSSYIHNIPKLFVQISSFFTISSLIIYLGCYLQNFYIIGLGAIIAGFCDCIIYSLALSIAALWNQKGLSIFNFGQSGIVAITTITIPFISSEIILFWSVLIQILSTIALLKNYIKITSLSQIKSID